MLQVGDLVIVSMVDDDEIECRVKSINGDQVVIQWPQDDDASGWVMSRSMMTRNPDGSWNAMLNRSDGVHPANRPAANRLSAPD